MTDVNSPVGIHPYYRYPVAGALRWETVVKMALVAAKREQSKPVVFRSRINGWWYYTMKAWQDPQYPGRR